MQYYKRKNFKESKAVQKQNKGFSLVELIIVIAIMAILVSVMAPQLLRYVEKTKRTRDVQTADEIANVFAIMGTYYNAYDFDLYEFGPGMMNAVSWQIDEPFNGLDMRADNFIEEISKPRSGEYNLGGVLFAELGEVPVSATNRKYCWNVVYDTHTGEVQIIQLFDISADGMSLNGVVELWPNPEAFLRDGFPE